MPPGPKTAVADWYRDSVLADLWGFSPRHFSSQAFWDHFDAIDVAEALTQPQADELERAQLALLEAFRSRDLVSQRVLAYDTTNFHTWIATTNTRNRLAQRGHSKQKRHDLRQVGLSYALDGAHGLSLCHHVYPGNVSDRDELPACLERITRLLDGTSIPRASVTLVLDKGSAALANTLELQASGLGWIAALPSVRWCTGPSTWAWCATRRASQPSSSRASARRWRKRRARCARWRARSRGRRTGTPSGAVESRSDARAVARGSSC